MLVAQRARPTLRRPGKVIAIVALMMVFLTGMVAFSIDMGYIAETRTELQRTADAGALAGVTKLALAPGQTYDLAAVRAEVKKFVSLNGGLTTRDEDITLLRYDPNAPAGSQYTTDFSKNPPNAVRVTVRRDSQANGPLNMFFAPVIGVKSTNVQATAIAYTEQAKGLMPYVPMIPYVIKDDWFASATGSNVPNVPGYATQDKMGISSTGTLTYGPDGRKEVLLFSDNKFTPGNYGSIDVGSASNGTPELARQILYGPSPSDFADKDFAHNVKNGVLYAPFTTGGDPGISNGTRDEFESIVGRTRIVPLFKNVGGNGNNTFYDIVGFAAVMITQVNMTGNPKEIWCQPTSIINYYVTSGNGKDGVPMPGVYTRPRLVIP